MKAAHGRIRVEQAQGDLIRAQTVEQRLVLGDQRRQDRFLVDQILDDQKAVLVKAS